MSLLPVSTLPMVDTITLGGFVVPGKCTLLSAKKEFGWLQKYAYGLQQGFLFPAPDKLITARFKIEIWTSEQFTAFDTLRKLYLTKAIFVAGPTSLAIGIDHPELKRLGVTDVVVLEANPLIQAEAGLWSTEIAFLQWFPFEVVLVKENPKTSIPDVPVAAIVAKNQREEVLLQLRAEVERAKGEFTK